MTADTFEFRKNGTDSALIFLHGFTGDIRETWGDFPLYLVAQPDLVDWDVISVRFSSNLFIPELRGLWKAAPEIQKLADTLATRIRTIFDSYRQIAFVAHSMGGLVVQRALLDCEATRRKTSHLFLFGTPSNGLVKAAIGMKITGKRQIRDMAEGGQFITRLRRDWEEKIGFDNFPFHFQSVGGDEDEFVPATSAHGNFPRAHCQSIPGGHLEIVKPASPDHLAVRIVANGLRANQISENLFPMKDSKHSKDDPSSQGKDIKSVYISGNNYGVVSTGNDHRISMNSRGSHSSNSSFSNIITEFQPDDIEKLIELLIQCPCMRERSSRNLVVSRLPLKVQDGIERHQSIRNDVESILLRCADFPDGIDQLVHSVRRSDDGTFQYTSFVKEWSLLKNNQ